MSVASSESFKLVLDGRNGQEEWLLSVVVAFEELLLLSAQRVPPIGKTSDCVLFAHFICTHDDLASVEQVTSIPSLVFSVPGRVVSMSCISFDRMLLMTEFTSCSSV